MNAERNLETEMCDLFLPSLLMLAKRQANDSRVVTCLLIISLYPFGDSKKREGTTRVGNMSTL
ncbi:MAG: hypothetical protein PWP37_818 [Thermotogota bacterium]|nr:hypothetical protein [Thermotogota bacterium]